MKRLKLNFLLIMLMSMVGMNSFAQFSGAGSGTESDPYQITNAVQLNEVRNHLDKAFKLMNDIDMTAYLEDEYPYFGWLPIGTFKGSFNGNNKTISGLWIISKSGDCAGLFSICQGATIKNLTLKNVNIKGNKYVGAICGYMKGQSGQSNSITNCNISGKIEGDTYVGGCIGQHDGGYCTLSQITSSANVIGTGFVGGLIGVFQGGSSAITSCIVQSSISGGTVGGIFGKCISVNITGCGFIGNVTGKYSVGGIGASSTGTKMKVDNCFSFATITSESSCAGGIFGSASGCDLTNCFSKGSVTGGKRTGGLVGSFMDGSMNYCYFDGDVKGTTEVGGLFGGSGTEGQVTSGAIVHKNVSIAKSISAEDEYGRVFGYHSNDYYAGGNKAYNRMKIIVNGHEIDPSTITDSSENGTGVGETTLKQKSTYSGMDWDFTNVWTIKDSEGFPYLKIAEDYIIPDKIQVDGLYYSLDIMNMQAQVTSMPDGKYTGSIVIPSTVKYKAKTYSVTSIGIDAFRNCTGLTSVTIPNSVTSIGGYAFSGCTGLTSVTIPNSMTNIGDYAFCVCSALTSVEIPNSVTKIGNGAFASCKKLTSVIIPNSVTSIGGSAFTSCSKLSSVTIGNSVTSIGYGAFEGCDVLTSVTVINPTPISINSTIFSNRANAILHVPAGSKSAYEAAEYWKEFKEIIEGDGRPKNVSNLTIISISAVTYTGSASTPPVMVMDGSTTLTNGTDYTVSYSNNINAGTATVTISGKGNYTGTKTTTFTIQKASLTVTAKSYTINQGDPFPTFEAYYAGFVNGETSSVLTTQPIFNCSASSTSTPGEYPITVSGAEAENYEISYAAGKLIVTEADPEPIIYDEDDVISVAEVSVSPSKSADFAIDLTNKTTGLTAYQFDLVLPVGFSIATNEKGKYLVSKTERYEDDSQTLNVSKVEGDANTYRFVCFSLSNGEITGENGAILNVVLNVNQNMVDGTYEGNISNIVFTKTDGKQLKLKDAQFNMVITSIIPGDANGDGEVNVTDIVEIVNYIMERPSDKFVFAAADVNEDSEINVTDIVKVVSIIMSTNNARAFGTVGNNESTIYDRLQLKTNDDHTLSLNLENETGYVASQFDLILSDGQTLETIALNNKRSNGHALTYSQTGTNTYRVVIYSLENQRYSDNIGELLNIAVSGRGAVTVENILFITQGQEEKRFAPLSSQTTGINVIDQSDDLFNGDWYDLQGRKIVNPSRGHIPAGIYIVNGKKYVVK